MTGRTNVVTDVLAAMVGQPCWGLVRSWHGYRLDVHFGEPFLDVREPRASRSESEVARRIAARRGVRPRGTWHLLTWGARWTTLQGDQVMAYCEDDRVDPELRDLSGQRLVAARYEPLGTTVLRFDLGGVLELQPAPGEFDYPVDLWSIHERSGMVLTARADGNVCHSPGNTRPDEKQWVPGAAGSVG